MMEVQLDLFREPRERPCPPSPEIRTRILSDIAAASAQDVGDRYGVSRNVVLGLVYRTRKLGIDVPTYCPPARVESNVVVLRPPLPTPMVRPPVVGTLAPLLRVDVVPVVSIAPATRFGPVPLLDAGPRQCRAVVDDAEVLCCGAPVEGRGSWCAAHRAAFRAPGKLRPVPISEDYFA